MYDDDHGDNIMTEKRFFKYKETVCDKDMKVPITYWQNKEQQEKYCKELNALCEQSYPICFVCEYCFRDDWYGVCCKNKESKHYTRSWDLELQTKCEHFKFDKNWEY